MDVDQFRGVGVALVTPMHSDGTVDEDALHHHVGYQVVGGVDFLVPCGTTGESATLSPDEQHRVIQVVVDASAGRSTVMAGAGGNDTARVVDLAQAAVAAGATALLSVSPAYNKPTPAGIVAHYRAIAEAVEVPIFLYNVPGRTASNMSPDVVLELAQVENICGIKEASGEIEQVMALVRDRPEGFLILSGDDLLTLPLIGIGIDGTISVVANHAPGGVSEMVHAALRGDFETARATHYRLLPLMQANFLETNPIPVKTGLSMMGRMQESYRLPLVPMAKDSPTRTILRAALLEAGLLSAST